MDRRRSANTSSNYMERNIRRTARRNPSQASAQRTAPYEQPQRTAPSNAKRSRSYAHGSRQHTSNQRSMRQRQSYSSYQRSQGSKRTWIIAAAVVLIVAIVLLRLFACSSANEEAAIENTPSSLTTVSQETASTALAAPERDRTATSSSANDVKPTEKVVYLTFDDGPSENTQRILDTLDEYGIKATWFVIGNTGHLDEVSDIWDRGHQIGLHSNEHDYEIIYANPSNFVTDINTIGQAVKARLGFMPTLIRYPGGSSNGYNAGRASQFTEAATNNGWHYFDWNVSIGDSTQPPAPVEALVENIKRESEGCNSCCVLMHDSDFKPTTADALPEVIEYFIDQGYTFDILTSDSFGYHF